MPRPKKQPEPKPTPKPEVQIVPDGDFAGMPVDDVLRLTADRISDDLGDLDLDTAGAALDMAVSDYLQVTAHAAGPLRAKDAAVQFMLTCVPYAKPEVDDQRPTYKQLREGRK